MFEGLELDADTIAMNSTNPSVLATVSLAISMKRIADVAERLSKSDSHNLADFIIDVAKRIKDAGL